MALGGAGEIGMRSVRRYRTAVVWAGVAVFAAMSPAAAQAPYPPPPPPYGAVPAPRLSGEAGEIAACLCLGQAVGVLGADMAAKQRARDEINADLSRLDAELQRARAGMDVNDPAAVARFRELLERRDAAFRRSTGLITGDLSSATAHYNARVNEYNSRCANRPRDPGLLASVQATLSCPPPY
jgi:hypothetical protein